MKKLIPLLFVVGCTTVTDDRMCLDRKNSIEVVEECTPMYGNMICVTKEKPRYWCVLYDESSTEQQNLHGSNSRVSKDSLG
jgi:hypothetical protein